MKRGLFIILFIVFILFISGLQSCQPTISIGTQNTCCKLSSTSNLNCINNIDEDSCYLLYTQYTYYSGEDWQTNLPNSCNDVSGCSAALSCTYKDNDYQDNIVENGEKVCFEENSKIYQCLDGKWVVSKDCSTGPIIGCENRQTCINPAITIKQCSTGNCGICIPSCSYSSVCDNGPVPDNCGGTCVRNTDKLNCLIGDCNNPDCVSLSQGNVLLYHFDNKSADGESAAYIRDYSGMGHGASCSGAACPTWTSDGKLGSGAYQFYGTVDYLNVDSNGILDITNAITISAWIYWKGGATGSIVSKRSGDPVTGTNYQVSATSDGKIQLCAPTCVYSNSVLIANEWSHIVAIRSGNEVYFYKNGVSAGNSSITTAMQTTVAPLRIGANYVSEVMTSYFNGLIDELAIWNRALTNADVSNLYQTGTGLPVCSSCISGFCNNQQCIHCLLEDSFLSLLYHFDNKIADGEDDTHIHDYSGRGHDTSCSGPSCPTWISAGKIGGGYSFDGGQDYINAGGDNSLLSTTNAITISAWIYWKGGTGVVVSKRGDDGVNYQFSATSDGKIQLCAPTCVYSNSVLTENEWIHIVVIRSGNDVSFYRNGVSAGTYSITSPWQTTTSPLRIGTVYFNGAFWTYFNGIIDEVAIWNRALTPAEASSLYLNGLSVCLPG